MTEKMQKVLKEVSEIIEPSKEDLGRIKNFLKMFKENIKKEIAKQKLDADIFEGGSFAKKTLMKKDVYDVDLFIRFGKKHLGENISVLAKKILKNFKNADIIHGSRDYFRIKESDNFFIELIPVLKVKDPKKAENITDLSYSHVQYINKKIKSKKILDDIKIAKAFCHFSGTYGAESYIKGFSGYSLELLIHYYGSFLKFIKETARHKEGKIIIDIEKHYKKKNDVLLDINSSKLDSPIILIDPTFKQRNAIAALSNETFEKFKKACRKFLKNPSMSFFKIKEIDLEKIKSASLKKQEEFLIIEADTLKQEGDIAGSKLLKFYNYIEREISKFFDIKKKEFLYNNKKSAVYFFSAQKKPKIIFEGPFIHDEQNVKRFKKLHKDIFIKGKKVYAKEKINLNLKSFILKWKNKNKKILKDMSISGLMIIDG